MFREKHMNLYTIFEHAQLLEGLRTFQRRRFPFHEIEERSAPKSVDPLMPHILDRDRAVAREGDRVARKVNRIVVAIDNYFYLVRRRSVGGVLERMRGSDDVDLRIRAKRINEAVQERGLGQGFVSLDVEDEFESGRFADDLGDAIGAALMPFRGHRDLGAPIEGGFRDAHIVRGDDYRI